MTEHICQSRRRLLARVAVGVAVIPLARLAVAAPDAPPHLSPDDLVAKQLHYTSDASKLDPKTESSYVAGSHCGSCALFHGSKAVGGWAPCDVFTKNAVNQNGWCLSYTLA